MKLVLLPDPPSLAVHVAEWLAHKIAVTARPLRISLSGGTTPKAMFDVLASPEYKMVDWPRVHLFWGDERFVPPAHPDSNYGAAQARLLSKIKIPDANVHPIPTDGAPAEAASRYQQTLQTAYGATVLDPGRPLFDITFLGLGEDGHTASLLPGQPVLDEREGWVAEVAGGRPETRITLTYPPLESSAVVDGGSQEKHFVTRAGRRSEPACGAIASARRSHLVCRPCRRRCLKVDSLLPPANRVADRLKARKETLAIAESSVGGLISAALLATPGASSFFLGGAVVYTSASREGLLGITAADMAHTRSATEAYALLMARAVRQKMGAVWALAETGAAGPTGNRYGDAAGHACFAIAGPVEQIMTLETASADRIANMRAFGMTALALLLRALPD